MFRLDLLAVLRWKPFAPGVFPSLIFTKPRQGSMTFLSNTCSIKLIIFFSTASEEGNETTILVVEMEGISGFMSL